MAKITISPETEALWNASPMLLDACKMAVHLHEGSRGATAAQLRIGLGMVADMARDAIAKAEGRP